MKNTILIPLVSVSFFLFGWWIYWAFPNGPGISGDLVLENDGFGANELALPWGTAMGINLADELTWFFGRRFYYSPGLLPQLFQVQ